MPKTDIDIDPTLRPMSLTRQQLAEGLERLGLRPGDHVTVHAALSSLGHVEGGAETVIAALLDVIGPTGTLLMPHFFPLFEGALNWAQPPAPYTGLIPSRLRAWPGAHLSVHPTHPVVALGPAAGWLTDGHWRVSAVGQGSPFDRLAKLGGQVLLLGVTQSTNTTIHTGEAHARVPYWGQSRPDRPAGRQVILPGQAPQWMPVIEYPGDSGGFPKLEPLLIERGLIAFGRLGRARCRRMPAQSLIDAAVDCLRRDPGGLLCDRPDCAYCAWARRFLPAGAQTLAPASLSTDRR